MQLTLPYEYISTPGKTTKLGTADSTNRSVPGWERTYNALVSIGTTESAHYPTMPARHIKVK